jgi:hypothetical protein
MRRGRVYPQAGFSCDTPETKKHPPIFFTTSKQCIMTVTWSNYRLMLPESKWELFRLLAGGKNQKAIVYKDGVLRYANAEEI